MEHSLEIGRPAPVGPVKRVLLPRPARRALPFALFGATVYTLTHAGWAFWSDGSPGMADTWRSFFFPPALAHGLPYALSAIAILGAHEMGHYLACRYYGVRATPPFFLPALSLPHVPLFGTFGAFIRIRGPIPSRRALFDIAAAGPLAGFAVALPVLTAGILVAAPAPATPDGGGLGHNLLTWLLVAATRDEAVSLNGLISAGWFGMLVTSLNLFPVGQLDGGHTVYAVIPQGHRSVGLAAVCLMMTFVAWDSIRRGGPSAYLLWTVLLLLFLRRGHPRLIDEFTPLGPARSLLAAVLLLLFFTSFIPFPL